MSFTDQEIGYLRSQPIARLTSVSADGQPDVIPLSSEFDGTFFWVGGSGPTIVDTRKFRNVRAGNHKVSIAIDDVVSFDPFIARDIRICGHAEQPFKRVGMVGPATYMRITPTILELEHGRRTRRQHLVRVEANRPPDPDPHLRNSPRRPC